MKKRIKNILIWTVIILVVVGWAYLVEALSPGAPVQAFFLSLLLLTPTTIVLVLSVKELIRKARNGEHVWASQEEKTRKTPEACREAEAELALEILDRELLNIYNSLSRQYEKISDFLYLYPDYAARLKETERYKDWRGRLLFWADENIERLKEFYFNDGYTFYINKDLTLVNLFETNSMEQNPDADVVCEVSLKRVRLPENYFEYAFTVWEEEGQDDYSIGRPRSGYNDASTYSFALGIGLGAGMNLAGNDIHHSALDCGYSDGNCASDCVGQ